MDAFEVIVVDDGSDDRGPEIVNSFNDPRIRLTSQQNGGVSAARNRGIQESSYPIVSFLDADDLWEPEYLSEITYLMSAYPEAGVWATAWSYITQAGKTKPEFKLRDSFEGIIENYWTLLQPVHLLMSSCVTVRKSLFDKAGLFDTRIHNGEDQDMWIRLVFNSHLAYSAKKLSNYRLTAENRVSLKFHPPESSWLYYNAKYNSYRAQNVDFRRHIDLKCIRQAYPRYRKHPDEEYVSALLEHVRFDLQSARWQRIHQHPLLWGSYYRLRSYLG
jgi:glycosyltransferase involved in cell wall biosynthesis